MPLLTFGEVIQHIKTKKPMPVYALHGPEPYFIDLLTDAFVDQLLSEEERAFNLEVFYGKETNINQIVDSLAQYPMGADIKLVIVKNAQELKNIEDLANYVNDPYPSSVLVISHSGKNLDGRKKLATVIKNKFGLFESKPMYDNQMPAWIKAEVEKSGKTISDQNSALIAEFLGTDLKKIHNELEKTIIAVGESKNITQQHIEDFIGINREFNVFELNAAIFTKNALKAQLVVNYLKDNFNKQPLVVILGSMFNSFIKLYTLKATGANSDIQITTVINSRSISAIKEYKAGLQNFSIADLDLALYLFKKYDQYSKGIDNTINNDGELLKELVFKLLHLKELASSSSK